MPWRTDLHPTTEELNACVQCGLCLPACPTFRLTGRETASPRGRLQAMSAVHEGVAEVDATFASILDFCLGCRACEPVCPGMVPYGRALEGARAEISAQLPDRPRRRLLHRRVIPSRFALAATTAAIRLARLTGVSSLLPRRIRRLVSGVRPLRGRGPMVRGWASGGSGQGRVALLTGCVQDEWFRPVNRAAVTLLERAGYRVEAPEGQTCCGALAAHDGLPEVARALAEENSTTFAGYDLVVGTAAGCSAHLAGYQHWAGSGDKVASRAVDVTVAVSRAIAAGMLPTLRSDLGPVAIQDPCHLRHGLRVEAEPRHLLQAAGFTVVETDPAAMCCGAAGLYTMSNPETSAELGNLKAAQIRHTGVKRVASANPGCEMQIRAHLGAGFDVRHPIEWYLSALEGDV
jgi:glycolate oxidase iron-sulfur subunit